jgi:hypothetical protein
MILREVEDGKANPYSFSRMQTIVQRMQKEIGLPVEFTLDACRQGGMTGRREHQDIDPLIRNESAPQNRVILPAACTMG